VYQPISDFFDLRPQREARFDISRTLSFLVASGARDNIALLTEDNQSKIPFIKEDGSTNNIKLRIG
jgi:hypothetical protein